MDYKGVLIARFSYDCPEDLEFGLEISSLLGNHQVGIKKLQLIRHLIELQQKITDLQVRAINISHYSRGNDT